MVHNLHLKMNEKYLMLKTTMLSKVWNLIFLMVESSVQFSQQNTQGSFDFATLPYSTEQIIFFKLLKLKIVV